ncbi:olfactory receptor 7A10-like [Urocitellus parryii]
MYAHKGSEPRSSPSTSREELVHVHDDLPTRDATQVSLRTQQTLQERTEENGSQSFYLRFPESPTSLSCSPDMVVSFASSHMHIEPGNYTLHLEFLLLGLAEDPELQPLIFGFFLSLYLVTVLGNLLIILAVISDSHLHMPMYFFLSNLSFVDICFTSTTIPKMLVNIQTQRKAISYAGCITQIHFFVIFAGLDIFLLTVMAYDRYVAICQPLHYMVIMNHQLCVMLVMVSWVGSFLHAILQSLMVLQLSFCTDLEIPHFFCELNQVVHRACSDTFLNDLVMYIMAVFLGGGPLTGILYSYCKIVSSIRAISSAQGKYKAFSTCASHLSVVFLFYGTSLGVYLSSAVTQNSHSIATASVMYTVVTPMLNPFIYSLRNKDIKSALRRLYICFTSNTIPKMLMNIQTQSKAITYAGCITQIHFFVLFAGLDDLLLTVMAYDPYVAICHPLHYMVIMNYRLCGLLVLVSLVVIQRACSDTYLNEVVIYVASFVLAVGPLIGILYSYFKILDVHSA